MKSLYNLLLTSIVTFFVPLGAECGGAPITLVNADFETDGAATPDGASPGSTGWAPPPPAGGFGVFTQDTFDPGADAGAAFAGENNFLRLGASGSGNDATLGGMSFAGGAQIDVATIMANTTYTLSVDVGSDARHSFPTNIPADDAYPPGFNGGNPIAFARLVNGAGGNIGFGETEGVTLLSNTSGPIAGGTIGNWTMVYQTNDAPGNLGDLLSIQLFLQSNTAGGYQELLFDNVSLDVVPFPELETVPEPATMALLACSGVLLAHCRQRRNRYDF